MNSKYVQLLNHNGFSPINRLPMIMSLKHTLIKPLASLNDILNSSTGSFQAGKHIELNPGFEVSGSSVFEAKIQNPCPL